MEWILVTAYVFLFLAIIQRLKFFEIAPITIRWIQTAFICKVLAGIALGLIYTYYYTDRSTADTFKFFDDSGILFNSMFSHPYDFFRMLTGFRGDDPGLQHYYVSMNAWLNKDVLFNDNKTIIRLNTLFRFFSLGHYYVHVVFLNFISFIGLFFMFRTFSVFVQGKVKELFFLIFFLPSVLFWGSGLLKDGILLFALGGLIYGSSKLISGSNSWKSLLLMVFSFVLLVFTKLYVIALIFPGLIAWYWSRQNNGMNVLIKFGFIYLVFFIAAFNIHYVLPKYNMVELLYWKQKNFYVLASLTNARSVIQIPGLDMTISNLILNSPLAFFNALTRPFLFDVGRNPLILLSALENLMIMVIIILVFLSRPWKKFKVESFPVLCVFFLVLMFGLIGLITPILGALVRYKIPALPFLIFLLVYLYDRENLFSRFPVLSKISPKLVLLLTAGPCFIFSG